jgi:hypothetical protein
MSEHLVYDASRFACLCGKRGWQITNGTVLRCTSCDRRYVLRWTASIVPTVACANPRCGAWFVVEDPRQRYCSPACSARVRQARVRQKASA